MKVEIIPFQDKYQKDFETLNLEWLEKYFYVEDYDRMILSEPKPHIINPGGHIFMALINKKAVGTVALIKREESVYELSKMAVTKKYKGLRIGQKLMYASIHYAGQLGIKRLFLDSNTVLIPAIKLYHKVGFKEIPLAQNTPYERYNIRMELFL